MNIGNLCVFWANSAQKKELQVITEKFEDIDADNINCLVRYSKERYIVWLDCKNEVDWETTDVYDKEMSENKCINKFIARVEAFQCQPTTKYLSSSQRKEFNYMLAATIVLILENELEGAEEQLVKLDKYLHSRNCEITRKWQLFDCFLILFLILCSFVCVRFFQEKLLNIINMSKEAFDILGYSVLGTLGATLSIALKSGKKCYNCESGRILNFLEVFSRMFTSVISSFIAVYLYKLDIIFSNFNSEQNATYCLVLVCIIAGFSERLIPSIISGFEKIENKEECCDEEKSINNI